MARRRPLFRSPGVALGLGLVAFGVGWLCLWDAYEGRGDRSPAILRPFTWW